MLLIIESIVLICVLPHPLKVLFFLCVLITIKLFAPCVGRDFISLTHSADTLCMSIATSYLLGRNNYVVSQARLLPFLRSDGGEGVWSIELTFLSQLRNLAAGIKVRPHVNCEYRYYSLEDGE